MPPNAALPRAGDANDGLPEWLRPLQSGGLGSPPPSSAPFPPAPADPRNSAAPYGYNQPGGVSGGFGQPLPQGQQWRQPQQSQQPQFSMGSLVSEDALPEWLRQAQGNGAPQSQPAPRGWDAPVAPPSPAQPAYNAVGAPPIPSAPANYGGYGQSGQFGYGTSGGPTFGTGQNQPPLPAAYGQMQGAGSPPGAGIPASSFFDESALPDWMRQAGAQPSAAPAASPYQQAPQAPANPYQQAPGMGYSGYQGQQQPQPSTLMLPAQPLQPVPQPPSNAFPSIDRAGGFQPVPQPQGGLAGQSLLDPGALPQWLSGQASAPAQSGHGGASLSGGMVAQSLVDESALPQWLRAQPDAPTPTAHAAPGFGAPAPAQPAAWNAAPVAEEPLPTWLNQVYSDANVPRTDALLQQQASANPWGAAGGYRSSVSGPLAGGFGAGRTSGAPPAEASGVPGRQFVDESALPEWLRAQGAAATPSAAMPGMALMSAPDARAVPAYVPPAPSGTPEARPGMSFSASDLIDPDLLPQWVRGDSSAGAGVANGPPPQATFSSTSGWTSKAPAAPGSGLLPPPPSVPAPSWQQSGTSDQLAAWQGNSPASQGSGSLSGGRAFGSGQLSDDGSRFGGGKSSAGGIPVQELPPWLQQAEPARAPERSMDAGRQSMAQAERWDRAPQQHDAAAWDDGYAEAGADFAWNDNQYGDNAVGYDERGGEYGGGAQPGYGQDAYDPNGYDGYGQDGYGQDGYDPNGYDAYGQNGYDPNGYDQDAYDPNGYDYDAPPEADERSGGWRRLFGRR